MGDPVFVDTNVFVYLHDDSDPAKKQRADEWISALVRDRSGRVSFQVLLELYATLTRGAEPAVNPAEARLIVRDLLAWRPVAVDAAIVERAWLLGGRAPISWWDSLIVAAAQVTGCGVLLTEDLHHGQAFGPVSVMNPFADPGRTPGDILTAMAEHRRRPRRRGRAAGRY